MAQPNTDVDDAADGLDDAHGESWQPVVVITREDIEISGLSTLDELLVDLADYNSFGLHQPLSLGYQMLVNGRHPVSSLELLPLSAVERIEVLRNGTTSLHDGVAIPGTINIVLRGDYDGFEVAAVGRLPRASSGHTGQASLLWGGDVGSGHLVIGLDSVHISEIPSANRSYSRSKWSADGSFADTTGVSIAGNTVIFQENGKSVARALGDCPTNLGYTGVLSNPASIDGEGCGFAWADIAWETKRFNSESVFANLDYPLSDTTSVYIDGLLSWADTAFRFAPSAGQLTILSPSADLLAAAGADTGPLTVNHRFLAHGNRDWTENYGEHDVIFGLQGKLQNNVSWDLSLNHYRYTEREVGNTFVSESLAIEAIESGDYDLTNPLSTDPDHRAAVAKMALNMRRDKAIDITAVKAALQGSGFTLPGGNLQWLAGFEINNQEIKDIIKHRDNAGKTYPLEDVLGSGGVSYEGQRSRKSGFAEVQFPPLPNWTILLAAQLDDYNDVESTHALTAVSTWNVNDMVMLYSSFQRDSSPPSLSDLYSTGSTVYPYICDTKNSTGPLADCDVTQIKTIYAGNLDLEPSKSKKWSFGGTMELGHLSLAADWFRVEKSNLPSRVSNQSIVDREAQEGSSSLVTRQNDAITEIRNPLVNTGESRLSGFSLSGHTDLSTGALDTDLDAHWAYITENESKVDGIVQPGDFPQHRIHAALSVGWDNMTAAWHTRAVSGYENSRGTGRFAPWVGHDVTLEFRDAFSMKGVVMQAGVLNVTNRGPSVDSADPSVADLRNDSVRGRTFFLRTELSW